MTDGAALTLTTAELAAVACAMSSVGSPPSGELTFAFLAGGRSNLMFRVSDSDRSWVLRMPPRLGRTPSAHDVLREFRVTKALNGHGVPVASPVVAGDDPALGGPFLVMEYVAGRTLRYRDQLDEIDDAAVDAITRELVGTLAALHRVDHVRLGLESFGRPDDYAGRQHRRWSRQWDGVGMPHLQTLFDEVRRRLGARLPRQARTGIVHGDYRIDNLILSGHRVAAVVDWELSTIGDPLADVAMMCAYRAPCFDLLLGKPAAWASDRLPGVDVLAAAYAAESDAPLVDWEAHLALAYFKIAVIAAGIHHRRTAVGCDATSDHDRSDDAVEPYLDLARKALS